MKTFRIALVALLLAASSLPLLRGDMPAVQTGQWAATGAMSDARGGASAALLPSGLVLVTGGTGTGGVLATAELFGPDGLFTAAGTMLSARADHASVVLGDGRVLVVGGRTSAGAVAAAETFGADGWAAAGQLTDARWGHTATLLADGRVLIVGGENESGLVGSVETFDPATGQFAVAGTLTSPRKGHAAARLADGRVLIAGGFGGGAALNSINIFDPSTGSISVGPSLASARAGLSATTLLDGKVLFFGGNDGTNDLASAEVFDPVAGTVTGTASAVTARRDHQAFLLPSNNSVLIVGGASAGAAVASAELYLPWVGEFRATGSMAAARAHATGSTLSRDGLLLVAGGDALASSESYGFATIKTDKDDYAPGTTVTMTGSGWQPGETVTLSMVESPLFDTHFLAPVKADANGNIVSTEFVPDEHDIGIRFYLTARAAASEAQTTFTDAVSLQSVSVGAQSPSGIQSGALATYPVTLAFNGNSGTCVATLSVTTGLPVGASVSSWSTNPVTATTNGNSTSTLTIITTGTGPMAGRTPQGTYTFTVQATAPGGNGCNADTKQATATLIVDNTGPAVTVNQAVGQADPTSTSPINFTVTFSEPVSGFAAADVTLSGTAGATTAIVTGGPTTYNVAVSGMSTTGTVIATVAAGVALDAALNPNAASTSTDNSVTFNSPCTAPSITTQPTSQSVTYGVASASFSAGASGTPVPTVQWQESINSGGSWANLGGATNTTLTLTNPTVSLSGHQYRAVFTNACGGPQTATTNAATLTVAPKSVTGSFTASDKPYDGTTSATVVTRAVSGVLAGDTANVTLTGGTATFGDANVAAGKTVTLAGATLSGSAAGNYNLTSVATTTAAITAVNITGSFTASDKPYDGTTSATVVTRAVSGVLAGDTANVQLTGGTATFGDANVAAGKTVTLAGATLSGSAAGNYNLTSVSTTTANITAVDITGSFTTQNKQYDGTTSATVVTRAVSGVLAGDTANVTLTGGTATFGDANVADGKTVTLSGATLTGSAACNYNLTSVATTTANITALGITGSFGADNKEYDGNNTATVTSGSRALSGVLAGDVSNVSLTGGTATFANKHVGNSKVVTLSGATLTGSAAGNYSLTSVATTTANITSKNLHVTATADSRPYNGTTTAAGHLADDRIGGDVFTDTYTSATFANKNAGNGKTVSLAGIAIVGADAGNYNLTNTTATATADITQRNVSVTATADSRPYDGTTAAVAHLADDRIVGDVFTDTYTSATFADKNVGTGKTVTVTGIGITGADAGNYNLTNATATALANITPATPTIHVTAASAIFTGSPYAGPTTCTADGVSTEHPAASLTYVGTGSTSYGPSATSPTSVGTYNAVCSAGGTGTNYVATSGSAAFGIGAWTLRGFYQPVGETQTYNILNPASFVWNTVKGGSTVPLKFNVYKAAVEGTNIADIKYLRFDSLACNAAALEDPIDPSLLVSTGGTSLRYSGTPGSDGQFIQNWATPKVNAQTCYRVVMTTQDNSVLVAFFKLNK
jgi:hypothetical protein